MTDPLFDASQALREMGEIESEASRSTRARVLASARQGQRRRAHRALFAIPLAALAIGSVAMAATGGYLPAPLQRWVTQVVGGSPKPAHRPPSKAAREPSPPSVSSESPAASATTNDVNVPETAAAASAALPEPAQGTLSAGVASTTAPSTPSTLPDKAHLVAGDSLITEAEFERYRVAHDAHFVRKDPSAALAAWSDYLAHAPSGRLAVEARYNQALCLLKLGRKGEARRALLPFVSGAFGSYRKQEARTLIATLDADAGR